jgi:hypothetical protein
MAAFLCHCRRYGASLGELTRATLRRGLLLVNMQKPVYIMRL